MNRPRPALRVLVVDDNHLIRRLLVLMLEGAGFDAVEAESAEDAIALAQETPPDLWLVDEVMPGMTGSELIRALRRSADPRLRAVPVIGISGREGADRELLAAGASAFVPKPVEEQALLDALARVAPATPRHGGTPPALPV